MGKEQLPQRLPWWLSGKQSACNEGDTRDTGLIPRPGRSPGVENVKSFNYSCLGNPMDRGAWWAAVHGVTKSWTQLTNTSSFFTHLLVNTS